MSRIIMKAYELFFFAELSFYLVCFSFKGKIKYNSLNIVGKGKLRKAQTLRFVMLWSAYIFVLLVYRRGKEEDHIPKATYNFKVLGVRLYKYHRKEYFIKISF